MKRIKYNIKEYAFREVVCNWLENYDLSKLHYVEQYEHFERETDQSTKWHKKFYDMIRTDESFNDTYVKFLTDVIKPRYGEQIVYQKIPTFRVHQPNNLAVAAFHRDSEYSHSTHEINFFLPLTRAFDNNTIWAESEKGKGGTVNDKV